MLSRQPDYYIVVRGTTSSPKILYIQRTFRISYIVKIFALMISPNSAQHIDFIANFLNFNCNYFRSYRYISINKLTKTKKKRFVRQFIHKLYHKK
jgi:hypothetical protein